MLKFRVHRGIKKAFDTIDHNILLRKLRICGVVLTQSVLNDLSFIFSAEVKDVALLASCHRFLVASHRVATLDHFYS